MPRATSNPAGDGRGSSRKTLLPCTGGFETRPLRRQGITRGAFGPLRRDKVAAQASLVAVILHIAAAAIYVYIPGVLPGRSDATGFHKYALLRQWSEADWSFAIGARLYEEFLADVRIKGEEIQVKVP